MADNDGIAEAVLARRRRTAICQARPSWSVIQDAL